MLIVLQTVSLDRKTSCLAFLKGSTLLTALKRGLISLKACIQVLNKE